MAEEVQSVVKLLLPLTDLEAAEVNQPSQANPLDTALLQLQKVARTLALNHTSQVSFGHAHMWHAHISSYVARLFFCIRTSLQCKASSNHNIHMHQQQKSLNL